MKVKVSTEATVELTEAAASYELEVSGLGEQLISSFELATKKLSKPTTRTGHWPSSQAWSKKINSSTVSFLLGDHSE